MTVGGFILEDVKLLKKLEIFRDLNSFETAKVGKLLKTADYGKGDKVVSQGEKGESLFIVKEGEVIVTRSDGEGKDETLAILGEGDHFGEIALIDMQPRSADVSAMVDTRLLTMERRDLEGLFAHDSELAAKVYRSFALTLCKRLRDANENALLASSHKN